MQKARGGALLDCSGGNTSGDSLTYYFHPDPIFDPGPLHDLKHFHGDAIPTV
jgi:hypothetical protein